MTKYVLDKSKRWTGERFASLESSWDPVTIGHLERIGVGEGWTCLEVGGGGGSIGAWLGTRVGPSGQVVVTDINPRWIGRGLTPNVEVVRHDIVVDDLDADCFDLVHARLVLLHLPERDRALEQMVRALKPGGWLLIDDFDCTWLPIIGDWREPGDEYLFLRAADAFHWLLAEGGVDVAHGRRFYPWLTSHELSNVHVDGQMQIWPGGSTGARLWQANIEQLRPQILAHGLLTENEIERFERLLDDPGFSVTSYLLVSGWGQRRAKEPSRK